MSSKPVRTRIAPSPTGEYHIGHIRTCLYDYALARQSGGQFVVRIEDTDQKRLVPGAVERILKDITDYGMTWDEGPDVNGPYGPYTQTLRLNIYQKYLKELIDKGLAYYCFCTEDRLTEMRTVQKATHQLPKYDRHCLHLSPEEIQKNLESGVPYVVRLRVPDNEIISFTDAVRGLIKINSNDIDDQVLMKSNGIPTYQFAVVVDDHLMNITHIFRGEEWITSTPKQIILYHAFGWEIPIFAHLTVLMDPDGHGKMSKRKGSVSARSFLDGGYLPEALLNFLMLLGWNPGTDRELFTLDDFVKEFSLDHLHKKSPIFDRKKLDYFNGLYIRQKTEAQLRPYFQKFLPQATDVQLDILIPVLKERLVKFGDLPELVNFLFTDVDFDKTLLSSENALKMLSSSLDYFKNNPDLVVDKIKEDLMALIKENGWKVGDFFMVFRVAICGVTHTPPVVECLPAMTQADVIRKLEIAIEKLQA